MQKESWVGVPDYPAYEVSDLGRFRICNYRGTGKKKIMKPGFDKDGYLLIGFVRDGKVKTFRAHRVVAQVFIPNPDNKPEVNHKKGIKSDNRANELEWTTTKANIQHAFDTGLKQALKGVASTSSKLTESDVLDIRSRVKAKAKQRDLAKEFGVTFQTISSIVKRKCWRHI